MERERERVRGQWQSNGRLNGGERREGEKEGRKARKERTLKEKSAAVGRREDALFPGCKYVVKINNMGWPGRSKNIFTKQ